MTAAMSPPPDDRKARLARARRAAEEREKARLEAAEDRELEVLELEARFTAELGERGSQFEIVPTIEGAIVVKLGPSVLQKKFNSAKNTSDADVHDFVSPCVVHPSVERYTEIVDRRPGIAWDCALALQKLFHGKDEAATGKS